MYKYMKDQHESFYRHKQCLVFTLCCVFFFSGTAPYLLQVAMIQFHQVCCIFVVSLFYRGLARQACCMVGTIVSFSYGRKNVLSLLLLPCNMAAVQNLKNDIACLTCYCCTKLFQCSKTILQAIIDPVQWFDRQFGHIFSKLQIAVKKIHTKTKKTKIFSNINIWELESTY